MKQQHITQRSLASEIGLSFQLLNAKLHCFTLRDVSRIADFFDVSVDSLLGREPLEMK